MPDYTLTFDGRDIPRLDLVDVHETRPARRGATFRIRSSTRIELFDPSFDLYDGAMGAPVRVERTRDDRREVCGGILESIDPIRIHAHGAGWSAA